MNYRKLHKQQLNFRTFAVVGVCLWLVGCASIKKPAPDRDDYDRVGDSSGHEQPKGGYEKILPE